MSTISRRAFLKTVGVGALSVAAMSVLAGCDVAGAPETPIADVTVIPGTAGRSYSFGDYDVVATASQSTPFGTVWYTAFDGAKSNVIEINDYVAKWNSATTSSEDREEGLEACNKAANTAAAYELVTYTFTITNHSKEDLTIASTSVATPANNSAVVSNTTVFTATCDGKSIPCAVQMGSASNSPAVVDLTAAGKEVTVYVAAPVNVKEVKIKVALPGQTAAVEYTVKNQAYLDLSKL